VENRNKSPFAETSQVTSPIHDKHALMGMKIESVEADGQSARVNTTGAAFVFDLPNDAIICSQKIPRRRKVATIHGLSLKCLKPVSKTPDRCVFGETAEQETLVVSADSLLTISLAPGATVDITGSYRPAWEGQESNCLFLPDETGGVGLYLIGNGSGTKPVSKDTEWTVNYQTASSSKLLVSVFPPRPFDIQQSGETLLHSFSWRRPYPSDQELAAWRPIGSVLALHSWIWQGSQGSTYGIEQDDSWATMAFVPKDAQELQRVVEAAHRLGMKVIPYMSPYYFGNPGGQVVKSTLGRFLNTVQDVLSQYGFDGVYYDGLYAGISTAVITCHAGLAK